jgi:hypothetical protein
LHNPDKGVYFLDDWRGNLYKIDTVPTFRTGAVLKHLR